ncbi:HNH endonuclease signature motif containing protein [Pseudoxanthomonas kaohsiungensis]|uniref:HNH endonuclease signature motif containing protein n=1 Tax=Pseudoxanthomonas kaohsiungensis TaxID=283923 RepID=A0ABW3M196_9GAMM|nr:HNH endonuclease signature motif containing protein [Pseudoxanthomonas kaohsiungensis]KAF1702949.1 HNH endonuclease [Pseudoxanthomonas kaohsiungensis]
MLCVELVPTSAWKSNVRSVVRPGTWDRIKRDVSTAASYRCVTCGRAGSGHPVECHEIWAYDDDRGVQALAGLAALCPDCHMVKHFGLAVARGQSEYALRWLAQVNTWTPAQAFAHVKEAFRIHAERSRRSWRLDVGLLERRYGVRLGTDGTEA